MNDTILKRGIDIDFDATVKRLFPSDWIAFMRNGAIAIDEVWHCGKASDGSPVYYTMSHDIVKADEVLEIRRMN